MTRTVSGLLPWMVQMRFGESSPGTFCSIRFLPSHSESFQCLRSSVSRSAWDEGGALRRAWSCSSGMRMYTRESARQATVRSSVAATVFISLASVPPGHLLLKTEHQVIGGFGTRLPVYASKFLLLVRTGALALRNSETERILVVTERQHFADQETPWRPLATLFPIRTKHSGKKATSPRSPPSCANPAKHLLLLLA